MMEGEAVLQRPRRGDAGLADELEAGEVENRRMEAAQPQREGKDAKVLQDVVRLEEEMKAIQAVVDDEKRNVRDQERLAQRPDLATMLEPSIAIRTEEIRQKRLALPADVASWDLAGLEGALTTKKDLIDDLKGRIQTVDASI